MGLREKSAKGGVVIGELGRAIEGHTERLVERGGEAEGRDGGSGWEGGGGQEVELLEAVEGGEVLGVSGLRGGG